MLAARTAFWNQAHYSSPLSVTVKLFRMILFFLVHLMNVVDVVCPCSSFPLINPPPFFFTTHTHTTAGFQLSLKSGRRATKILPDLWSSPDFSLVPPPDQEMRRMWAVSRNWLLKKGGRGVIQTCSLHALDRHL